MSQYREPPIGETIENMIRSIHQRQWVLEDRLFGNGQPGEIQIMKSDIFKLTLEQTRQKTAVESAGSVFKSYIIPIVSVAVSVCALGYAMLHGHS